MPPSLRRNNPEQNEILNGRSTVAFSSQQAQETNTAMVEPHENDILMGRGGKNNQHIGNEKLRGLARLQSDRYRMASKKGKSNISRELVRQVRLLRPPGRFLKKDTITGDWEDVGDDVAREKASQVLRDAVSVVSSPSEEGSEEETEPEELTTTEKRRSVSAPPVMATVTRRRTWHETGGHHSEQHRHHHGTRSAGYTTPRHEFYPPVTPSLQSAKRQRYHSEYWDGRMVNRMQTTPVRHPYADMARSYSYSAPGRHLTARDYESPAPLLGDVSTGFNEFDLFNGELLHSDEEESSPPPATDLHNDMF